MGRGTRLNNAAFNNENECVLSSTDTHSDTVTHTWGVLHTYNLFKHSNILDIKIVLKMLEDNLTIKITLNKDLEPGLVMYVVIF